MAFIHIWGNTEISRVVRKRGRVLGLGGGDLIGREGGCPVSSDARVR